MKGRLRPGTWVQCPTQEMRADLTRCPAAGQGPPMRARWTGMVCTGRSLQLSLARRRVAREKSAEHRFRVRRMRSGEHGRREGTTRLGPGRDARRRTVVRPTPSAIRQSDCVGCVWNYPPICTPASAPGASGKSDPLSTDCREPQLIALAPGRRAEQGLGEARSKWADSTKSENATDGRGSRLPRTRAGPPEAPGGGGTHSCEEMALTLVMMVVVMVVIVWLAAGHAIEQAGGDAGRRLRKNERARVGGALGGQRAGKRWRSGTTAPSCAR